MQGGINKEGRRDDKNKIATARNIKNLTNNLKGIYGFYEC